MNEGFVVEPTELGKPIRGISAEALECLERAYVNRDPNLPYLGVPVFDSLRGDPRFNDLLRRMNLPMWIEEG